MPEKEFELYEEDFIKTIMDYLIYQENISVKDFNETLLKKVLYASNITSSQQTISIKLKKGE